MFSLSKRSRSPGPGADRSRQVSLACVPVLNPEVTASENEDGELRLTYPVRVKPWFTGIFRKVSGRQSNIIERRLQLDLLGTSVWRMIDGKASVREIVRAFGQEHQLDQREAEISVSAFLRQLGRRGLLALREEKAG